jgi:DNA topoisomerase-1
VSGKTVVVKAGRFGPYVTDGETNATLPRSLPADALTFDDALALLNARRAAGGSKRPKWRGAARGSKAANGTGAKKSAGASKKAKGPATPPPKTAAKGGRKKAKAAGEEAV